MIYHLTLDRNLSPESLQTEGFVHCSTREQLLATAERYFRGVEGLRVLLLDPARLQAELRYEPPSGPGSPDELFPHLYGPINPDAVAGETVLQIRDGRFVWPHELDRVLQVDLKLLRRAVELTFKSLEESHGTSLIQVPNEHYWEIPAEARYNLEKDPEGFSLGLLSEDYENIKWAVAEDVPAWRAPAWVAAILLRLSELSSSGGPRTAASAPPGRGSGPGP